MSDGLDRSPPSANGRIRLGIVGLGAAGLAFAAPLRRHGRFDVVAACDPRSGALEEFAPEFGARSYSDFDAMLAAGGIDAVYLATPTELHRAQTLRALEAGCHVLVEKPMALTAAEAGGMVDAARKAGRVLVVGHSHGHDAPIRAMAEVLASGRYGRVRMVNSWCYTDWVYRPRRPDELRPELGGGVTFRQGAHQFDILLDLIGSRVVEVHANAMDWDPDRATVGAHIALLRFSCGAMASVVYNGYGRFLTSELTAGVGEWGYPAAPGPGRGPADLATGAQELAQKQARARSAIGSDAPAQPHFGLTLASAERAEIRQTPQGLAIYADGRCEHLPVSRDRVPRDLVLDEFADAIDGRRLPVHDGARGAHVIEICEAVLESSRTGAPVRLGGHDRGHAATK